MTLGRNGVGLPVEVRRDDAELEFSKLKPRDDSGSVS